MAVGEESCVQNIALLDANSSREVQLAGEFPCLESFVERLVYHSLWRSCTWVDVVCYPEEQDFHLRISDNGKSKTSFPAFQTSVVGDCRSGERGEVHGLTPSTPALEHILVKMSILSYGVRIAAFDEHGTCRERLEVVNGKLGSVCSKQSWFGHAAKPSSTNKTVFSLYQNVPVRKRDLMQNMAVHLDAIRTFLIAVSVCYPRVGFSLDIIASNRLQDYCMTLRETSTCLSRLRQTGLDQSNCSQLHHVNCRTSNFAVHGYLDISKPKRRTYHLLFLNNYLLSESSPVHQQFRSNLCDGLFMSSRKRTILYALFVSEHKQSCSFSAASQNMEASLHTISACITREVEYHSSSRFSEAAEGEGNLTGLAPNIPGDYSTISAGAVYHPVSTSLNFGCSSKSASRTPRDGSPWSNPRSHNDGSLSRYLRENRPFAGEEESASDKGSPRGIMTNLLQPLQSFAMTASQVKAEWSKVMDVSSGEMSLVNMRTGLCVTPSDVRQGVDLDRRTASARIDESSKWQVKEIPIKGSTTNLRLSQLHTLTQSDRRLPSEDASSTSGQRMSDLLSHWNNPTLGSSAKVIIGLTYMYCV